jgi:hypothetical protein
MARKMSSRLLLYVVKSRRLGSFRTDLSPKALNLIPWAASIKTTIGMAVSRVGENQLGTLLVFNTTGQLAGVLTASSEVALLGKKRRKQNAEVLNDCWAKCERACAEKGGRFSANVTYDRKVT